MSVLCCNLRASRAMCTFYYSTKLTNHYNKNSTIKAKPLIFSGLASFFTFFKPRHPISVKKLRANRRFHCEKGAVGCRHRATCIQRPPCSHSSSVWGSDWRMRISSALRPLRVSRSAARPADDMSDALRPPVGSPRSCGSRC